MVLIKKTITVTVIITKLFLAYRNRKIKTRGDIGINRATILQLEL